MNRVSGPSRFGLLVAASGMGALGLIVALLWGGRLDPAAEPSADPRMDLAARPATKLPGAPGAAREALPPLESDPPPVELPIGPAEPPIAAPEPCGNIQFAQETFQRARELLECTDPGTIALAREFLKQVAPDPRERLPKEVMDAILEAKTDAFHEALSGVLRELGTLAARNPNAYVHDQELPDEYSAIQFEVHADEFGERRPMIVSYTGKQGRGFAVPRNFAGRQLALQKIMLDDGDAEPEWYEFFAPPHEPR
ncbi:MAG: hypothetical protein ACKO32_03495 [Planctomycetia bacterium]